MIEKIISVISPKWSLEREKYRRAQTLLQKRRYEGAAKGRRTDGWIANGTDANSEVFSGLTILRNRSRDLLRNNPYARAAQSAVVTSVVGDGIVGQIRETGNKEAEALALKWKDWCDSTDADADGVHNFFGIQALGKASAFESGEVLIRRIYPKSGEYKHVPLKLQVLEADFLDLDKNEELSNGGRIVQGVEFDKRGKIQAYWIFNTHPGSARGAIKSSRFPAQDIAHVKRVERPGQVRAVPWLTPVMIPLNDLDGYQDAQLLKQKISACFTGFIRDTDANAYGDTTDESTISDKFEPGALEVLPPGKDIEFANPPSSGDYESFTRATLRKIASGVGITYESLTSDYSQSNFSSSRMAERVFNKNVDSWRWNMIIPQLLDKVWDWFVEAAMLEGVTKNYYPINWIPPKRELLNPKEDNEAAIMAIRGGLESWSEVIMARGKDPEEQLQRMANDNKRFDELKIVLDSDARKMMKAGIMQQPTAAKELDENSK
jgi:lambda family phage portal protein